MSELLRRGFLAALAPVGAPNVDIVVADREGARSCSIRAKTRHGLGSDGGWYMNSKHEKLTADTLFYCFVDFGDEPPNVFVMPSAEVAEFFVRRIVGT